MVQAGLIAGVLGAYMLLFPFARILTIIPFFIFIHTVEIPALYFLGLWFLYQLLLGILTSNAAGSGGCLLGSCRRIHRRYSPIEGI